MSDLISRQAAIEALDKRFDSIPMETNFGNIDVAERFARVTARTARAH